MMEQRMSEVVARRLETAARRLGAASPLGYIKPLLERSFSLPAGDDRYAYNRLTPGAAPVEPSFSEEEPQVLRFTMQPLGPESPPLSRRDEATREMRRLVEPLFGREALRWFDSRSEEWRGSGNGGRLSYGAFFGSSYDHDGLRSSKVYYELQPNQVMALPGGVQRLAQVAMEAMPQLRPVFTSITCKRDRGGQRITFMHSEPLRLADLQPLMRQLGLHRRHPGLMQLFGVALGGRFELPAGSALLSLGETPEGPEMELYVLLAMLPDLPQRFLDLLALSLSERPKHLHALGSWLQAFTPEQFKWPGDFSILSVHTTARSGPSVSLYLRPMEFEILQQDRNA